MHDCIVSPQPSKSRKREPHLIAIPKGFVPHSHFPDETARFASTLMRMTSMRKERIGGEYIPFGVGLFRTMFGGEKAAKVKAATVASSAFRWKHDSKIGEYPESVKLSDRYRTGEFELHEVKMKVRKKTAQSDNLMRLGPVGMALTARLDRFQEGEESAPSNHWEHYQLDCIRRGNIYSDRCEFGRFHSNYTSLSKTLRRNLRTKSNDQLTALDITNCQPLILGIVTRNQSPTPYCSTLSAWLDWTQKGLIYEFAAESLTAITGRKWERQEAKDLFLPFMFDRVDRMRRNLLWQVFEQDFSSVLDCICRIKGERYQALSHRLMSLEAEIMIDGVAAKFMQKHPDAPILTIHDELIVPTQYADSARGLIETEFGRYGVRPKVKPVSFNKGATQND